MRLMMTMKQLVLTFPSLRDAVILNLIPEAVLEPFDAEAFDGCAGAWITAGSQEAMRFVLSVWAGQCFQRTKQNHPTKAVWRVGAFDVHRALGRWDDAHRRAFAAWVSDPWWP